MRLRKRTPIAAGVVAGLVLGLFTAPLAALAAPVGAFDALTLQKQSDGYSFTNNPVDNDGDNDVVAVNDFVGFRIQANTDEAVNGAVVTLTKPSCWVWESTVDQNLTFTFDGGQTTGTVSHPDANTVVVSWTQAASGSVLTQPFRAQAGPGCEDGSTWTPTLTYEDGSGSHTQTLDTITVRSVPRADISVSAVGSPDPVANRWFGGDIGTVNAMHQRWQIKLSPATLSSVGYTDPDGNVTFTVAFASEPTANALRAAFEMPRPSGVSSCWSYVSPSASNNNQFYPSSSAQTVTITMSKAPACQGLLTQENTLVIDSFTPMQFVPQGSTLPLCATVTPSAWVDTHGTPIQETDLTNNRTCVNMTQAQPEYGYLIGSAIFAPKEADADYTHAYPWRNSNVPIVQWTHSAEWGAVTGGSIGIGGEFVSESFYSYDEPALNDMKSYHFWDPAKQQLNIARLDAAVLGSVAPSISSAQADPGAMNTRAFPRSSYTLECTGDFSGGNVNSAESMTWTDCDALDPSVISGVRFLYAGTFSGADYAPNWPNSSLLFSQVPMLAVGGAGQSTTTTTRWSANEFSSANRNRTAGVTIIGNELLLDKNADVTQVQPEGEIEYTLTPEIAQPAGTFLPAEVENLKIVDSVDVGVMSVDLSGLDPFWEATQEPADRGPDGVPYTADDVRGIRLTFTPAGAVNTGTALPEITYIAAMGILLPPTASPYNASVRNTAVLSADESAGSATANESVVAGTPEAAFFSKELISEPIIEVEDPDTAWRVQWVNYNNYSLGQGRFVDVFPYDGDGRGTDFAGTSKLVQIVRVGAAAQPGTVVELTADAPGTVGVSPSASTDWVVVDPADPATWPAGPTAIRITVPNIAASTQGYGAVDLHFEVADHRKDDEYHNDASGQVFDPQQNRAIALGTRSGDPVHVIASSIAGVAWVDRNADGLRQSGEALLPGVTVHLYRDGDTSAPFRTLTTDANGAYRFTQLHSSDYRVVFDVDDLRAMGYRLTDQAVGGDTTIDSDADVDSGEVEQVALPRETDVEHLDAGLIAIGLQAEISADASLTRSYAWDIAKSATNGDDLGIDPATGAATVEYSVVTTEGAFTDSGARLSGEVTVTNPSDEKTYTFTATVAADGTGLACTVANGQNRSIAPSAVLTLDYSCTGAPGDDLDRAVGVTVAATDIDPATGQPVDPVHASTDVEYEVSEVNRTVHVTDAAEIGGAVRPDRDFGPYTWSAEGTEHAETYSVDATVPAGQCLAVDNEATIDETGQSAAVSLEPCLPLDLTIEKNVVTSLQRSYGWGIRKSLENPDVQLDDRGRATLEYEVVVTEGAREDASWSMTGEVAVSNPNRYKSVDATVADAADIGGGVECRFAGGATATVAAGQTRVLPYSCTFSSEPAYSGVNTATVSWTSDLAGTSRDPVEDRSAVATADIEEDAWTLTEFRKTVSVEDVASLDGEAGAPHEFGPYTWSAEGTEHAETYTVDIAVDAGTCLLIDNTATITGLGVGATTQHTVCRQAPLRVADPASAGLLRSYDWKIDKTLVNRAEIVADETPERVRPEYAVTVTEGESRDSAHHLSGRVEITNPNDFRAFVVDVENSIGIAGLDCRLARSTDVVVPAGATVKLPYTCAGDPGAVLSGTHSVVVTGDGFDAITHEEEVEYAITEANRTVTVTDDRFDFDPRWRITWSAPGTEHEREYALRVDTPAGECRVFDNTASLAETGQSATASFRVCGGDAETIDGPGTGTGVEEPGGPFGRLVTTGAAVGLPIALGSLLLLAGLVLVLRRRGGSSEA